MALYPLPVRLRVIFYYDLVSVSLWGSCLGRFLVLLPLVGRRFLPGGIADFFHLVSILPLIGFFIVKLLRRSALSRRDIWSFLNGLRLVWISYGIIYPHPKIAKHTAYSFLILGWCTSNLIDSIYHSFKLKTRSSPRFLFKLHYSHFYVTFPIIFISELIMVFLSLVFVENRIHDLLIQACALSYVPIGYFTFKFLVRRKKVKYVEYMEKLSQRSSRVSVELQNMSQATTSESSGAAP